MGKIKQEPISNGENIEDVQKKENSEISMQMQANIRRVNSLKNMKKEFQFQKNVIREALSNTDQKSKKIRFFDDETDDTARPKKKKKSKTSSGKMQLFEEQEEMIDTNFNLEFDQDAEKTRKLIELRSKIPDGERFKITEKFLENDDESSSDENKKPVEEQSEKEITYEEEKRKEFAVLQEVLGKTKTISATSKKEKHVERKMLRFDPNQPEHSVFEIDPKKLKADDKRKVTHDVVDESVADTNAAAPEVSKTIFYDVADDLKEAFKTKASFSFLPTEEHEFDDEQHVSGENQKISKPEKSKSVNNTFGSTKKEAVKEIRMPSTFVAQEPFFFRKDDYRLQEGRDFMARFENEEMPQFLKTRRSLKEILRVKIKRSQQNGSFRTKIGNAQKRIKRKKMFKKA